MIVDYFYPSGAYLKTHKGLVHNDEAPFLYERTRGADGVLKEKVITPEDDGYIFPSCWVRADIPQWQMNKIVSRYPGAKFDKSKTAVGLDGYPLIKLTVNHPGNLWDIKEEYPYTYEADLSFVDQYIIQKYPDGIPDFNPRIWYLDLEWDPKEDFTTVMAVVDNQDKTPMVFAWKSDGMNLQGDAYVNHVRNTTSIDTPSIDFIDREGGYLLHLYDNESDMHEGFLNYMEERNPDILVAHAGNWADFPHLHRRLEDPNRMSPINQVLVPKKESGYKETAQPIKGRLVFDSAARGMSGSGFESIWQKSGRGQMSSRSLNWVAQSLELGEKLTDRVEGMTVFNGWYEYFDDFVDYCLVDTTLLRDVDEKLHAVEFHVAMMKLCGVSFPSTNKVTRYFRGLIARRTELKAPSSKAQNREDLQAAYIPDPISGRHIGVGLFDYASLYPNIILSLNLCWTTKRDGPGENIKSPGNGTHWDQTEQGLFPSVVSEMLALRKEYKKKMYAATNPDEKLGYDMLQTATKVAVNALYGMVSMGKIGGMWSDLDIGKTITHMGRDSIRFLLAESEKQGYKGLYGHTDSAFIQVPLEEAEALAEHLTKEAQKQLDMPYMDVELEAYFDYWISAQTKNRYFGIKTYPESDKGKMKVTGFELKAANAAPITKEVQSVLFNLVGNGAEEDEVTNALRPITKAVLSGEYPVQKLSPYGRIKRPFSEYKSNIPMQVRAAKNYNENITTIDPFKPGDGAQWTFIKEIPEGKSHFVKFHKEIKANVIAFRKPDEISDYSIDYETIVEKFVMAKIKPVYQTLGWDLDKVDASIAVPEVYW